MKILIVSSEVVPFAKTGGLADVASALAVALEGLGVDVRVAMPYYKSKIKNQKSKIEKINGREIKVGKIGKAVPVYFIESDKYFNHPEIYGDMQGDYSDNLEAFSYFCKETLKLLEDIDFKPDVIHCNDWQTALISVYLKALLKDEPFFKEIKVLFTIHNLAYQGLFPKDKFDKIGIGKEYFSIEGLEFWDKMSLLKGGLIFSDVLTTVSSAYAKEIQTEEFGCGLDGVLRGRAKSLYGILNGVDYSLWNPATDRYIFKRYSVEDIDSKYENKLAFQKELGLEVNREAPLIGIISRLAEQKGVDLIAEKIEDIVGMGAEFVLLGTGEKKFHILFEKLEEKCPGKVSINLKYDAALAQKIYAGSDIFLMPSRYEPCGLGQIISLKYGTIPVVRKTGGLADTITDYDADKETGNGFVFEEYSAEAFMEAVQRALSCYADTGEWRTLVERGMRCDFSWEKSASKYLELYRAVIS